MESLLTATAKKFFNFSQQPPGNLNTAAAAAAATATAKSL